MHFSAKVLFVIAANTIVANAQLVTSVVTLPAYTATGAVVTFPGAVKTAVYTPVVVPAPAGAPAGAPAETTLVPFVPGPAPAPAGGGTSASGSGTETETKPTNGVAPAYVFCYCD
jgi:hypothetical protein